MRKLIPTYNKNVKKLGESVLSCYSPSSIYKFTKKQSLSQWQDQYLRITEAWHLHEPKISSEYRNGLLQIINNISDAIINNKCEYNKILKGVFYPDFAEFIYTEPFPNDTILACLNKLKIYVGFDDNTDAFTINDNKENDKVIPIYLPLFKATNSRPTLISIFIILDNDIQYNRENIENELYQIIPHELKHVMDNAYNRLAMSKTSDLNEFLYELEAEIESTPNINLIFQKEWLYNRNDFLWFINECLYRTEETEISAYLETTYHEYQEIYKDTPEHYDLISSEVYFYNWKLDNIICKLISNKNNFDKIYEKDINFILENFNKIYHTKYTKLNELLYYMHNKFRKYFKKVAVIFYNVKEGNDKK